MLNHIVNLIFIVNSILFVGLILALSWWQKKHSRLMGNKVPLILTGFLSFACITTLAPLFMVNSRATIAIDFIFLLIFWCIEYPFFRWVYRRFRSPK